MHARTTVASATAGSAPRSDSCVGASGTWAGRPIANSLRGTGIPSSLSRLRYEHTQPTAAGYRTRTEYRAGEQIPVGYATESLAVDALLRGR
ncbi:hypothetical protein ACWF82_00790 [Nocardia sp. NPDC055053]